ncbi:Crp/Fnr family transcriptional regulator [soil metagenome]
MAFGGTMGASLARPRPIENIWDSKIESVARPHGTKGSGLQHRGTPMIATGNSILDNLPTGTDRLLASLTESVYLPQDQILYQEEDRIGSVYFPVTAVVSEFRVLEDGRMVEIAVTGHEGAVGLSNVISGSLTAFNYTQVTQAGVAKRIDAAELERILCSDVQLRYILSRHTDHYIRQISQKSICNMYHSVKERLCTWLLMVQDRCGRTKMNLTHEQIARILGVNRPSVSRMAHELQESKIISYSRGGLRICDREKVERSACTCYSELGGAGASAFAI